MTDRRVLFFATAAVVCALLVLVAPPEFRWVCWVMAAVYVVLAVASLFDGLSRRHATRSPHPSFRNSSRQDAP